MREKETIMENEIALPTGFKEVMREKILSTFLGLIPQEKIDALMKTEVDAFFNVEQLLTIEETKVLFKNPNYDPNDRWSKRDLEKSTVAYGSKMTPFRQMVWSTLHNAIKPRVQGVIDDEQSKLNTELKEWLVQEATPKTTEVFKISFTQTAQALSNSLFYKTMEGAIRISHENMRLCLSQTGVDMNRLPSSPPLQPVQTF